MRLQAVYYIVMHLIIVKYVCLLIQNGNQYTFLLYKMYMLLFLIYKYQLLLDVGL